MYLKDTEVEVGWLQYSGRDGGTDFDNTRSDATLQMQSVKMKVLLLLILVRCVEVIGRSGM